MKQVVIGLSGHIDHGKTTLVHALTGVNTDSLSEEEELLKRRRFAVEQGASEHALEVLDKLCADYESNYYKFSERIL